MPWWISSIRAASDNWGFFSYLSVKGLLDGHADQTNFAKKYWLKHPEHLPFNATESAA